ncbi:MAG: glycine--tRNA ligase [Flavobacteriaceae bacterium]|nr:glycine--tRNA ligase [Flavobacteriaceae bacterium]
MTSEEKFKKVISHAKEYGFVFQSSEIYDGLSAVYDYGQNGTELKNNIKNYWWKAMVQLNENIVGLDSSILMHPTVWKASGHIDAFNDPLIDNKDSKKRYRADILIEDYISKIETKIQKEIFKAEKKFGNQFDRDQFLNTNSRVIQYQSKIKSIHSDFSKALENEDLISLKKIIEDLEIACPISGSKNWTEIKQFNLMFGTKLGASSESAMDLYLRPETAQGIFVNFLNVQKTSRLKIPFGIAQIGKAFRNEIVARQFIFRMREFEQMEMQFFIKPGTQKDWYNKWKEDRMKWHLSLGLGQENYRFHDHEKLAHYADAACDIEFNFPFGFKELEGIHSRTDFDLSNHEKFSSKKLKYFDTQKNESFIPYVLETSIGVDRMFLAVFSNSLCNEKLENGSSRIVLKLPAILAPCKVAILPLLKKDGLPEIAKNLLEKLKTEYSVSYDEKDAIGRRYRRQDALGTPYCITIDHQSKEDSTYTLRERDSMSQERLSEDEILKKIESKLSIKSWM